MQTAQRQVDSGVIQQLLDKPQRFGFCQAVRLLERWLVHRGVPRPLLAKCLRFANSTSLAFPQSDIRSLRVEGHPNASEHSMREAIARNRLPRIHVTPAFMGFLGMHGALPLHVTEALQRRVQDGHGAQPLAFFDVLLNRIATLFYRSWRRHRLHMRVAGGRDAIAAPMLALVGKPSGFANAAIPDGAAIFYAAHLRQHGTSAAAMERVLGHYFDVPVAITPSQGGWERVPDEFQLRLGGANAQLGGPCVLGGRMWRRDCRASVSIGPLTREQYLHFLPGQECAARLRDMVGMFAVSTLQFDVRLKVRKEAVCGAALDGTARLGRDSFLVYGIADTDREDVRYTIRT